MMMMMMMVYYCLSKRTPLLNTHTFTPVESELNTLSAALAASKQLLKAPPRRDRSVDLPQRRVSLRRLGHARARGARARVNFLFVLIN
jgi:hypothetical protein